MRESRLGSPLLGVEHAAHLAEGFSEHAALLPTDLRLFVVSFTGEKILDDDIYIYIWRKTIQKQHTQKT